MFKSYSLAFVAVVICLPIILLSSESDAQPTVDETESCSFSQLEEVTSVVKRELQVVKAFQSSNQEQNANGFRDVKNLLVSNLSNTVEEVASNVTRELKEVKAFLSSDHEENAREIKEVKKLLVSNLSNKVEEVTSNVTTGLIELKANQEEVASIMTREIREVKNLLASNLSNTVEEITSKVSTELTEIKNLLVSTQERSCVNAKQAFVSALICKYTSSHSNNMKIK